jgi:phosphate-selective porin OprO/OprP
VRNRFIPFSLFSILLGWSFVTHAVDSYTQIQSGYRDGFFVKTEDDRFSLKVGSRINFGYTYGFVTPAENVSSFDLQHAKFYFGGNAFGPHLQYYFQAAGANNTRAAGFGPVPETLNQGFILEDYYIRLLYDGIDLKMGQFKVPFARQWMIYSGNLEFVQRSSATQAFLLGRDRGVTLSRYGDHWSFTGGVFNGAGTIQSTTNPFQFQTGQNQSNDAIQKGMLYVGRFSYTPLGQIGYSEGDVEQTQGHRLELAGGFVYDHNRDYDFNADGIIDDFGVSTMSASGELIWKSEGMSLQGEYFYRRHQAPTVQNFTSTGYYIQPAAFIIPRKLEAGVRFGRLDPNKLIPNNNIWEGSAVLNYYYSADHRFKTQLQYTWFGMDRVTGFNNDGYIDLSIQLTI